ncbi:MAG: MotA/TolQ/ExbB proton channel family protein [Myxococcota bacterium]
MNEANPQDALAMFELSGTALIFILGGSVLVLALALEQLFTFWGLVEKARELGSEVGKLLIHGDLQAARTVCERSSSPVADIFIAALNTAQRPGQSEQRAAERERQRFALWMRRRLWAIGTVGALAPFVGLFGTVVGIIRAFRDIGLSGTGGFSVVAAGVAEALYATAGGIFVAVVAVMFFNYFQSRGNQATVEVKLVVDEFLEQLEAGRSLFPGGAPETRVKEAS